jgi:DNA-binding transcriptional MocR family regulator
MTGTDVASAPKRGADFLQLSAAAAPVRGLTRWLADAVRAAIIDGRLQAGAPLPATRLLADDLGVSRGVIVEAYQRLADEGLVSARPRAAAGEPGAGGSGSGQEPGSDGSGPASAALAGGGRDRPLPRRA